MNTSLLKVLRFVSIYVAGVLFFTSAGLSPVYAQGSSALTIIPPKFELFGNPGDSITEKVRIRNEAESPMSYSVLIEDFTTTGEEGAVVLEEDQPKDTISFSLAQWIEPSMKDVILQPKEEKAFTFIINIPRNAEPGGHYASILFQSGGDANIQGGANVAQRIGTLILLRVSGNVVEQATLENFSAPQYLEHGPVTFLTRVKNDSNTHIRPQGTIVITDLFGKKVDEIPLAGRNVLPGAIRKMETSWNQKNIMGIYTATMIATYGQNKPLTAAVKFTVIPKLVLLGMFVAAVALIGFVVTLIVGRSRLVKILNVIAKG